MGAPAAVAGGRVLDLDNLGPQAGQQLGGKRQGGHLFDGQDPYAVKGPLSPVVVLYGLLDVRGPHGLPVCRI